MFLYGNIYILLYILLDMERQTVSLKHDPELWKEAKKKCIDKNTSYSEYVESLIKKDLGKK